MAVNVTLGLPRRQARGAGDGRRGGGAIVSTASVSGLLGDPASVVYSASKAAVINLTRSLAVDHARQHIRVNCICPGAIDTPPVGRMLADPRRAGGSEQAHLLGRIGRAGGDRRRRRVAGSDESSFITGQALVVDGGSDRAVPHPRDGRSPSPPAPRLTPAAARPGSCRGHEQEGTSM